MRPFVLLACIALLIPIPLEARAEVGRVVYRIEATAGSWQPIQPSDLRQAIEHAALEVLTKPAMMRLERVRGRGSNQARGDYELTIAGHMLDEAETHTVYLSFGPGEKSDVPSLNTSETVVLSKLSRGKMLEVIEASARKAAARLVKILKPQLERAARGDVDTTPPDELFKGVKKWPWHWSDVRIPKVSPGKGDNLYSKKQGVRETALRVLTSLALRESSPRQQLEKCALDHFDAQTRRGCLEALRPLSRTSEPTRRVVIEVFRRDKESRIRSEATDQMMYFTGPSRAAAVQAWLEAASKGKEYGPLAKLGDLPNLDLAIVKCLAATRVKKRVSSLRSPSTCIDLMDPIPYQRRRAILWRFISELDPDSPYYLEGLGEREGSHGTIWSSGLKALLEPMPEWDPKLEDILWRRYQRTLSSTALDVLCAWPPPSAKSSERLLEILKTTGNFRALHGLVRMGKGDPKLSPKIREALAEMLAMGAFAKDISKSNLERAVKDLEKAEAKQ